MRAQMTSAVGNTPPVGTVWAVVVDAVVVGGGVEVDAAVVVAGVEAVVVSFELLPQPASAAAIRSAGNHLPRVRRRPRAQVCA
jgi:hypothetical protein